MSSSRGSRKRPAYALEDAVQAMSPTPSETGSNSSSSPLRKKSRKSASERDADYPPIAYTNFIRETALEFYRIWSREVLIRQFFSGDIHGVAKLQDKLYQVFSEALEGSELYMNCNSTYFHYMEWLDQQVTMNTTNIVHMFECVHKKPKDGDYSEREKKFIIKLRWIQGQCSKFSTYKSRVRPWHVAALKSAMEKHMWGIVEFVPSRVKVLPLSNFAEGGYGKVRKVRIVGMQEIPDTICFAGKESKAGDETQKRYKRAIEAMVCIVRHPGVIKFWACHEDTMEAYTLWWNGDCIQKFLGKENSLVSEAIENSNIFKPPVTQPIRQLQRIHAFRSNRAKLAWALICLMYNVHEKKLMHNDISPGNVFLHFPEDKVTEVYIGVRDWSLASRVKETTPSKYGFSSEQELKASQSRCGWFVAPELWYTYGKPESETSLQRMQKRHLYSQAADAFSVGKIANCIWNNEFDKDLFKDSVGMSRFAGVLKELTTEDPKSRSTLAWVVSELTGSRYNFEILDCCYRKEI